MEANEKASVAKVPSPDIGAALKDAAIAALITLGLAAPIMGLVTVQSLGKVQLEPHWMRVVLAVAVVFVGRLVLNLTLWAPKAGKSAPLITPQVEAQLKTVTRYAAPVALAVAVLLPFVPGVERTTIDLATLVLIYVMLGWGLNIVVGLAGLLDLGYVAFYAVGAYSYALLSTQFGISFWLCLPLAGILAALWGVMLGFPVLRLRGDYLAIVTLAFGEIIRIVLLNWQWVTGGPNGIPNIPKPTFFGIDFTAGPGGFADTFGLTPSGVHRIIFMYYLILALALFTNYVVLRLRRLPIGRAWEALREDEIACRSLGVNTVNTKLTAFALGAMFAGFAGSFFATRQSLVSPESFTFIESALILAIVVLGGMGSQFGVALAALLMIGGFELFREFEDYRMMVFGVVMVLIMVWRPRGIVSSRSPSVFLKERKAISGSLVQEGHG
ncbi:high-affinity branched-chain amino acid ABC transporter permease LivM [Chelatococcus sambhunathii]|uniref:High-affinity branched-chain amino acid ABC transporter permease LivM n=1 Tax=Chelatococcus sambhunathii TaxID=363953 RepID=A0ABU1DJA9_9HYPH|nr:high-affinity branched-chain amino acid ABC transporter permease LivM [Chelatococcus sambhunathii]MDR4307970.1 high-affinity branched-chain amino acid ABC transporter permease LivM [Chelatococcus sambhunathii]